MKLKTLKEISKCPNCCREEEKCPEMFVLRQEAIKWIKNLQKFEDESEDKIPDCLKPFFYCENVHEDEFNQCDRLVNWIKYFFRITEKELK